VAVFERPYMMWFRLVLASHHKQLDVADIKCYEDHTSRKPLAAYPPLCQHITEGIG